MVLDRLKEAHLAQLELETLLPKPYHAASANHDIELRRHVEVTPEPAAFANNVERENGLS